jgi:two-component system sensor histidine kinase ChvG
LATVGANGKIRRDHFATAARRLFKSLTVKLVILVNIFAMLPFILYSQLEKADRETRDLLAASVRHRSWLIAQALTPVLEKPGAIFNPGFGSVLARYTQDGTILRLMFRPNAQAKPSGFFFVASAPLLQATQLDSEIISLQRRGILKSLEDSCSWGAPLEFRYGASSGEEELLTSVIPIATSAGCWVLVSTHNGSQFLSTSIGRSYWETEGVEIAAIVYLVFAVLAGLIVVSVKRSLRHFQTVARRITRGGVSSASFAKGDVLPELAGVAGDFDKLVHELWRTAADIRRTAEDNAHAFKTPLATIRSALEPLKRIVPEANQRALRATQLIDSSLDRLTALVSIAQRFGNDTADFIQAPKRGVNFTNVVLATLQNVRDAAARREVEIVHRLTVDVIVLAPDRILDIIVENILDNAISFSKPGETITVTLSKRHGRIDLFIDDQGPGIEPNKIEYVFERYISIRPPERSGGACIVLADQPSHAGLGLWIVRRHVEALGGTVAATNLPTGGLRIHVVLPSNGQ